MDKQQKLLIASKCQKLIGIVFLLVSLLVPFASAITLTSSSIEKTYGSAFIFMFGGDIKTQNITYETQGVSVFSLISYILILSAAILIGLSFIKFKKQCASKWLLFIASLLILASSIMFLCVHKSVSNVLADALISSHSDTVSNTIFENTVVNFGFWGVSIFGFISSFLLLISLIFDGTFDKVRSKIGII